MSQEQLHSMEIAQEKPRKSIGELAPNLPFEIINAMAINLSLVVADENKQIVLIQNFKRSWDKIKHEHPNVSYGSILRMMMIDQQSPEKGGADLGFRYLAILVFGEIASYMQEVDSLYEWIGEYWEHDGSIKVAGETIGLVIENAKKRLIL